MLNNADKMEYGGVTATMSNLNRQDGGLEGLRLRYRRKGVDTWNVHKQWSDNTELWPMGYEPMPEGSTFKQQVVFLEDGTYELQAQTFGKYGNDEVTYESNIIEIIQDTHGPQILGMVSHEDGTLTYADRNNMHLRFNETLNGNTLSKSANFRIEGGMNNVVFGESKYPDVAVQLNGNRIETDARYDLSDTNYAFDMWFYRQADGTIISIGTEDNLLALSTHNDGFLQARIGTDTDVYETGVQLPKDKWMYMAMNYKRKTTDDPQNRITMLYANADADDIEPVYIGKEQEANDLTANGKLGVGGDGMHGMVAQLSIWNSDITAEQLYQTRTTARAAYTPGLVGYWNMAEGHGTQINDIARSRHMYMESESWYINNENRAAHLDGDDNSPLKIDIATFNPSKTDNFAYEMWFRGNEADNPGQVNILSAGDINLYFNEGLLQLHAATNDVTLSNGKYLDNNWHHLAFNVRRGTSAIAYIDGQAVKVLPEANVPSISSHYLVVGGLLSTDDATGQELTTNRFKGDVDEVRIWSASLDGDLIKERMYERMDNSYPGLVGYFPMENIHRTAQGNVVTDFSTANFGEQDYQQHILIANAESVTQSINAPALKPGSTKMRLDDSQFNFTASADEIYFSFPDSSLPLMDNNDFVANVNYIKDEHGNNSETVQWNFHTDFAAVDWQPEDGTALINFYKNWDETGYMYLTLRNRTEVSQPYEITGLPSWLSTSEAVGTIEGDAKYIQFVIAPTVSIGKHTEYLYVTDRLGIQRVMQMNLTVKGNEPDWTVDPNLFESNMTLTGQIYNNDKICENTDTKIAVFDDMGLCRGVGSPTYVATRDAYYVDMVIYGASATELSSGERELSFKLYDASTGNIQPLVIVMVPGKDASLTLTYIPDANYGSYNSPVALRAIDFIQEPVSLPKGWAWMSIYVDPVLNNITNILPQDPTILKRFKNIKSKTQFASVNSSGEILGELVTMFPGEMYKMQLSTKTEFNIYGLLIDAVNTPQTIHPGYNWIGSLSNRVMSLEDAFADLNPEAGDRIKNRTAFAEYNGNGVWEGTLKSIVPGEGYIYQSLATNDKTFHYPHSTSGSMAAPRAPMNDEPVMTNYELPDPYFYPDNMNIIAVVKKDGQLRNDAEVAAFIGDECRGAITYNSGYYFLTIMGDSEQDAYQEMQLRVFIDAEEYIVNNQLQFLSDAFYGTLDEPFILDVDATAIRTVVTDHNDAEDTEWYTLQGYKIGRRPIQRGVYIHKGQKVTVK